MFPRIEHGKTPALKLARKGDGDRWSKLPSNISSDIVVSASANKIWIHINVTVRKLDGVFSAEPIRAGGFESAAFSPDPIPEDIAAIRHAAQIM